MAYNFCLLQIRHTSYLHAVAVKTILVNRKLFISSSEGMNDGVDNLSHLDLFWGEMFRSTVRLDCRCTLFENLCFQPNHDSTQQESKSKEVGSLSFSFSSFLHCPFVLLGTRRWLEMANLLYPATEVGPYWIVCLLLAGFICWLCFCLKSLGGLWKEVIKFSLKDLLWGWQGVRGVPCSSYWNDTIPTVGQPPPVSAGLWAAC